MATVDITIGVQMKQRESKRDEAEEGEGRRHHQWGAIMSLEATEGVKLLQEEKTNLYDQCFRSKTEKPSKRYVKCIPRFMFYDFL